MRWASTTGGSGFDVASVSVMWRFFLQRIDCDLWFRPQLCDLLDQAPDCLPLAIGGKCLFGDNFIELFDLTRNVRQLNFERCQA